MLLYPPSSISTNTSRDFKDGTLYNGDCLDVIKELPTASVDCIITDPPYFLGMTHNGKKGNFRDLSICRPFYRDLFHEFARVAKPEACIYFFCDWRGYAFYYPLFDEILRANNMLVWNKLSGPGNHYAFFHELVLFHAGKGVNIRGKNIITDVKAFRSGACSTDGAKVHPTQKPVELIEKLINDSHTPPGCGARYLRGRRDYGRGSSTNRAPLCGHRAGRGLFPDSMQARRG